MEELEDKKVDTTCLSSENLRKSLAKEISSQRHSKGKVQ
jgi:hypothetical protein